MLAPRVTFSHGFRVPLQVLLLQCPLLTPVHRAKSNGSRSTLWAS